MNSAPMPICENEEECSKPANHDCHHCPKRLCLIHLNEHNDFNMVRVEELSDEMNKVTYMLTNLNSKDSLENVRNKLNQWRQETLDQIERIYEGQSQAIHRLETELNNRLEIFKGSLESSISDSKEKILYYKKINETTRQNISSIESNINKLRQCLQSVECAVTLKIEDISFENYIQIDNVFSYDRDLLENKAVQSYQTVPVQNMTKFVSSKEQRTILWLDQQRQLHFVDQDLQEYLLTLPQLNHQVGRNDNEIIDMKWCAFAEEFLILLRRYLYSFNPKTNQVKLIPMNRYQNYPLLCITCLNDSLIFISYAIPGICIEQWKYSSGIECLKHWDNLTNNKTEWICSMNTNSIFQTGLLIRRGETIYRRFELRDERLEVLKQIPLDYVAAIYPIRSQFWFIKTSSEKYHVYSNETGKYVAFDFNFPFGLDEFGLNTIIIGNTQNELNFCDI